jgi:hypothetical protein
MRILMATGLLVVSLMFSWVSEGSQEKLPEAVHIAAEKAEDVIDFFLAGDWKSAGGLVDGIGSAEAEIEKTMNDNRMPASSAYELGYLIFQMKELVQEKTRPVQAALVSNQLTALLTDLQGYYAHSAPLEIAWMDYLGREIVLLAKEQDDYGLLEKRVSELGRTWDKIRAEVKSRDGKEASDRVDEVLSELKGKASRTQMMKNGNRVLDLVDELEALFR